MEKNVKITLIATGLLLLIIVSVGLKRIFLSQPDKGGLPQNQQLKSRKGIQTRAPDPARLTPGIKAKTQIIKQSDYSPEKKTKRKIDPGPEVELFKEEAPPLELERLELEEPPVGVADISIPVLVDADGNVKGKIIDENGNLRRDLLESEEEFRIEFR